MSKFKVGDRVRVVDNRGSPRNYEVGEVGTIAKIVSVTVDNYTQLIELEGKNGSAMFGERFELIAPALTIQAGKFYKTRDGRKVGPLTYHPEETAARRFKAAEFQLDYHYDSAWYESGSFYEEPGSANDLIAEWADETVAVVPATATFKVGDRVRRPGHLIGTVLGVDGDNVRIDYGSYWGERTFTVAELELVEGAPPATIKVGDWVRTDDGYIGIVLHDDGSDCLQFKVGFVGDDNDDDWDWFSDLHLTIVPPGTTKVEPEPEPVAANDNYEVGDIVEIADDYYFSSSVSVGDLAAVTGFDSDGDLVLKVQTATGPLNQYARQNSGDVRPYRCAA